MFGDGDLHAVITPGVAVAGLEPVEFDADPLPGRV
jgi:hypothetical protein